MAETQVALVTGASRGIGQAIALALAGTGATVVGTATSAAGAAALSTWFEQQGLNGRGAVYDAAAPESAGALVADLEAHEGLPTILVNNAGIARDGLLLRMKDEDWDQTININLSAVFRLTKLCLKRMLKERRGRIINISSIIGAIGNPGQAHYAASKAGLIGFTRSLARELASRNVPGRCPSRSVRLTRGRYRWAASVRPRTWPARWFFWPEIRPVTSLARRCTSTAACTWASRWRPGLSSTANIQRNQALAKIAGGGGHNVPLQYAAVNRTEG
jgi:3-oxoacyl-[acyl-carrier protein] reductase